MAMEKIVFDLWESVQDNNYARCEEFILQGADLNYQARMMSLSIP